MLDQFDSYQQQLVAVGPAEVVAAHLALGAEGQQRLVARARVLGLQQRRLQVGPRAAAHLLHQRAVHVARLRHRRQVVGLRSRLRTLQISGVLF